MRRVIILSTTILLFPAFLLFAQGSDGSAVEPVSSTTTTPTETTSSLATSTGIAPVTESKTSTTTPVPRTVPLPTTPTTPSVTTGEVSSTSLPLPTESSIPDTSTEENNNILMYAGLLILATIPFGYLIMQSLQNIKPKDDKEDKKKCFDIKKILDEKLKELTDLKAKLESETKNKIKETIEEGVVGTTAGDTLIFMEKVEKEYEKLKKLYEECIIEFGERVLKGTIVENSLNNKDILNKVKIEKTYNSGNWVLHDVFVDENQIPELQKHLSSGPWYVHLWEQGKDDIKVVFKEKVFDIKFRDKSTWQDAIAYGKSIGIREEQLDFPID
jgi:hypothetical protein